MPKPSLSKNSSDSILVVIFRTVVRIFVHTSLTPCLINSQTLNTISQVESFLCPDEQGTSEEGRRIQRQKRSISIHLNKDKDKSPKNHNQNNDQASSKNFRRSCDST